MEAGQIWLLAIGITVLSGLLYLLYLLLTQVFAIDDENPFAAVLLVLGTPFLIVAGFLYVTVFMSLVFMALGVPLFLLYGLLAVLMAGYEKAGVGTEVQWEWGWWGILYNGTVVAGLVTIGGLAIYGGVVVYRNFLAWVERDKGRRGGRWRRLWLRLYPPARRAQERDKSPDQPRGD